MPDPALDLGTRLREARLRRGRTLREVAAVTKVPVAWLAAIERNEFDGLPHGIFRRAYVRAFAAEVGVNADPLPDTLLSDPDVALRAGHGGDGGWWRQQAPTLLTIALLLTAFVLVRGTWGPGQENGPALPPGGPAVPDFAVSDAPAADSTVDRADVAVQRAPASITMRFLGPCWVSAVADGGRIVHRLVAEGEHLELEARDAIAVEIGDAGAVEASINGGPVRVLGSPGEVLRMHVAAPFEPVHDVADAADA